MEKNQKLQQFIDYAQGIEVEQQVIDWMNTTLNNYLSKKEVEVSEVEHILDYLKNNNVPKINQMSYDQALKKAEKWNLSLQKKASAIEESAEDTRLVLDVGDGYRFVQLIGRNAYEREGYLMRHCVASYYGKNVKIYSLRDKNNNPHATIEHDMQIKGKGNGSIHPKYIGYIVAFLEHLGMSVRDSEMRNLGYINVENYKYIDTEKLFQKKYWYKQNKLIDRDGSEFASLDLLDQLPIVDEKTLKFNFDLKTFIPLSVNFLLKQIKKIDAKDDNIIGSAGNYAQIGSAGNYAQIGSSGDSARIGSSGDSARIDVSGQDTVCANIGLNSITRGVIGTWITLAEYDSNGKPLCVKSAKIDGKKLKENTWYKLENKKFKIVNL